MSVIWASPLEAADQIDRHLGLVVKTFGRKPKSMADIAILATTGLMGLIAGSFIAAASRRLPLGEPIMIGRSHCMTCRRTLAPWHLVPVASWLCLGGRCGWCRAAISPRYALIELSAAGIGLWAATAGLDGPTTLATAALGWWLLMIAIVDAENFWLPDVLTLPLIGTGLVFAAWSARGLPWPQAIGAIGGFASLWLVARLYRIVRRRDGLGGGDPILFAGAGAWAGWSGLPSVLLWACLTAFGLVVARLLVRRPVGRTERLPFGVFLTAGLWLTWLYGPLGH